MEEAKRIKADCVHAETMCAMLDEVLRFCKKRWDEDELIVAKENIMSAKEHIQKWIEENK